MKPHLDLKAELVEIRGDTTAQSRNAHNIDLTAFINTAFSANSAISAVFSQILEQILEQE